MRGDRGKTVEFAEDFFEGRLVLARRTAVFLLQALLNVPLKLLVALLLLLRLGLDVARPLSPPHLLRRFFTIQLRAFYLKISLRPTQLLPFLKLQSADGNLLVIVSQRVLLPKIIDLWIHPLIHLHHWIWLRCFVEAYLEIVATKAWFCLFVRLPFKARKLIGLQSELMCLINERYMLDKLLRHFFDDIIPDSN